MEGSGDDSNATRLGKVLYWNSEPVNVPYGDNGGTEVGVIVCVWEKQAARLLDVLESCHCGSSIVVRCVVSIPFVGLGNLIYLSKINFRLVG